MKKIVIIVGIVILVVAIVIVVFYQQLSKDMKENGMNGIGKKITVSIEETNDKDYTILDSIKFEMWNEEPKKELKNYMKENNLQIKEGTYEMNQTTSFEEAKEIFKFKKQ